MKLAVLALAMLPGIGLCAGTEKIYGPDYLKPGEIRQCLRDREQVVKLNQQLSAEKDRLEATGREISATETRLLRSNDALEAERAWLSRKNTELESLQHKSIDVEKDQNAKALTSRELDSYLDKSVALKQYRTDYQAHVDAYNSAVTAHKQDISAHNAAVISLNTRLAGLQKQADKADERCARKKSYADDLDAAKAAVEADDALTHGKLPQAGGR
ncbi:MAG: hypothetical protein ACRETW_15675 [Stenotrophobium sp.]